MTSSARVIDRRIPKNHVPHSTHSTSRIWPETNCYLDLCIELVHILGFDPTPMFACALSTDHDHDQWTFIKPEQNDLRELYGIEITEENVWRPVLETVESGPQRNILHTVEVDSWWLPDTSGTDYRSAHVKTTIVPLRVDRSAQRMTYLHNAGVHELSGDDFVGVFNLGEVPDAVLPPYVEQIRLVERHTSLAHVLVVARRHLDRRPDSNPIDRMSASVHRALEWLPAAGTGVFHLCSFATLRQCGATAEIAADLSSYLERNGAPGAGRAATHFRSVAELAKSVQFKVARAARGRSVVVDDLLETMAADWASAIGILDDAVPAIPAAALV